MKTKILFIAYFFDVKDGVGAQRSRYLNSYLESEDIETIVVDKFFFGKMAEKFFAFWMICLFFYMLFSKSKKAYVSCGPFVHLISILFTSVLKKRELIIDFRDPWSLNISRSNNHKSLKGYFKLKISRMIEKGLYKNCTNFIVCTRGMFKEYEKLFGDNKKLILMTNGYDFSPEMFVNKRENEIIQVVCLGKFAEYDYEKAKQTLLKLNRLLLNKEFELTFIGSDKLINEKLLKELKLLKVTKLYPRMDYYKALNIANECDYSLLVIRDESIDYGTKIFDYIGLNIPTISYTDEISEFYNEFHDYLYNGEKIEFNQSDKNKFYRGEIFKRNKFLFL